MPQSQSNSERSRASPRNGVAEFRMTSDELAPDRLVPTVNRELAQMPFGSQIAVLRDEPLQGEVVERRWPSLSVMWARCSPIRITRAGSVHANGSDSVLFSIADASRTIICGREHPQIAWEGMAIGNAGPGGTIYPFPCKQLTVIAPQTALRPLLRDKSAHFVQRVAPNSGALKMLVGYLDVLKDTTVPAGLEQSVATHLHDLLAVTLGATSDALEIARSRGIRAARLHAIKTDIESRLDTELSVATLAARHRVTPRYVQNLFEQEGTTFTEFVRNQRLERARTMLASPRCDHKQVSEIAFEVGFGDLSYFDRTFRRRFGLSPRDVRSRPGA
jgi:AraC-like DNA-binding protein